MQESPLALAHTVRDAENDGIAAESADLNERDQSMSPAPKTSTVLLSIAYAIALFTSAVTTFGWYGVIPGIAIPVVWGCVFLARSRPDALLHVVILAVLALVLIVLLLPAVQSARKISRRAQCKYQLMQIGLALHNYHDEYGSFPPAYTSDELGRPLLSWRVLLLPYVDQPLLYKRFHLDEPWDSPHNRELLHEIPETYRCPTSHLHEQRAAFNTSYVAVIGEQTAWPGATARQLREFEDGTSNAVLVIECNGDFPWTEPRDLTLDEAIELLADTEPFAAEGHRRTTFFYEYYSGRHVLIADGSVRHASHRLDRSVCEGVLSINSGDGDPVDDLTSTDHFAEAKRLRVGNCIKLGVFLILTVLPLPWVWLKSVSEIQ